MLTGNEFAKLFSENEELNELIEKVYSAGIEDGYDYAQKEFLKKEKKDKKRSKLSRESSGRGYGRSIILGGVIPGAVGTYAGSKEADQADSEGADSSEIKERATKKGALAGAAAGGALGLIGGMNVARATGNPVAALGTAAGAAALGGLGGALGANKNTRERLRKRRERMYYDEDED